MAVPTFRALCAAGFLGVAAPSSSPRPWPSSADPRLGSQLVSVPEGRFRRGRLRFMLRTAGLHLPWRKARPRASTPRSPQTPAGCYKGALVPPSAGLPPASHRELSGRTARRAPPTRSYSYQPKRVACTINASAFRFTWLGFRLWPVPNMDTTCALVEPDPLIGELGTVT
jgi:hypothetical protein